MRLAAAQDYLEGIHRDLTLGDEAQDVEPGMVLGAFLARCGGDYANRLRHEVALGSIARAANARHVYQGYLDAVDAINEYLEAGK